MNSYKHVWVSMGINAYIPLVPVLLMWIYSILVHGSLTQIIPALEMFFPLFSSWWCIFIYQDMLEEPGNETIFSYPIPRWKLGIQRAFFFYAAYLVVMILMLIGIGLIIGFNVFYSLSYQLGTESLFFAGLGFFSMTLTTSTGWSMVVVISYAITQIFTRGRLLPYINIYIFNNRMLSIKQLLPYSYVSVISGILFFVVAQYLISTNTRFK